MILTRANASLAFSVPAVSPQQVQSHYGNVSKAAFKAVARAVQAANMDRGLISCGHISGLDRSGYSVGNQPAGMTLAEPEAGGQRWRPQHESCGAQGLCHLLAALVMPLTQLSMMRCC